MYLNKTFIIGNLTRDPELKAIPTGSKVCTFGIATSFSFKDKDGNKQENVQYHNIVAFNRLGELAGQYLKKGQQVLVEGRLQTRSWETNGEKRYRTEIVADNIQFGPKSGSTGVGGSSGSAASAKGGESAAGDQAPSDGTSGEAIQYPSEEINPEDIPF